jgi:dTDP-4-dehydrorhamnose 3,5-epimerase
MSETNGNHDGEPGESGCENRTGRSEARLAGEMTTLIDRTANWELTPTGIPGCLKVHFPARPDERGLFVKTFQASAFLNSGLETEFTEMFYTVSGRDVLRGMHLQLPPADHAKLVYCVEGSVADVVLDLRRGSPTYGKHAVIELAAEMPTGVYLPRGVAHGFQVRSAPAILVYQVTSEYSSHLESGVSWDSFGAVWPVADPVISPRDQTLPRLADFESPFTFSEITW